jgi:Holliday junction resolvasome RuvABC DNA-binding subunit
MTQKQLEAIPGIGEKTAWKLISQRAKGKRKSREQPAYENAEAWFGAASIEWDERYSLYIKS